MSSVKERVLLIAEESGRNKVDFFKDLGLSYANFKGVQKSSALSSDAMVVILSKYNKVNPTWLLTGVGEMYTANVVRDGGEQYLPVAAGSNSGLSVVEALQTAIAALEQTVRSQEKTISSLERQLSVVEQLNSLKGL
ncbi:hypothetical protein [Sphingobacterium sp. SYP-B4668]|uniref:hypothetical protein n=1 Tax=Sphingobacterium sp. SYP-B4668 TaxID=2996035 RepID=UPI000532419A|nr:hypothetical protein [Sphingobacterium sp. SYP-B4668]